MLMFLAIGRGAMTGRHLRVFHADGAALAGRVGCHCF